MNLDLEQKGLSIGKWKTTFTTLSLEGFLFFFSIAFASAIVYQLFPFSYSQGEDATSTRLIQDRVVLSEVPSIMQAMGFYPSEHEIENLINEVKYSSLEEGVLVESITFDELIRRKL